MKPLYKLADNFMVIQNFIDKADEEEIDEESIKAMLDDIEGDIETKCINISVAIKNMESYIPAIKAAKLELAERQKKLEKKVSHLSNYLIENMYNKLGIDKIENDLFTISIRKCPLSVNIENNELVPAIYTKIEMIPDKIRIKEALMNGEFVPGAELIQNIRLSIK